MPIRILHQVLTCWVIGTFFCCFFSLHASLHWFIFLLSVIARLGLGSLADFLPRIVLADFLCLKLLPDFLAITLRTVLCDFPPLSNGMQGRISFNSSWDRDTFLRLNSDLWTNFHSHEHKSQFRLLSRADFHRRFAFSSLQFTRASWAYSKSLINFYRYLWNKIHSLDQVLTLYINQSPF